MFRILNRFSSTTTLPVGRYNFSERVCKSELLTLRIIKPDNVNIIIESCKNKNTNELTIDKINNVTNINKVDLSNIDELTEEELKQMYNFIV